MTGVIFVVRDGCLLSRQWWVSSLGSETGVFFVARGGCLLWGQRRVSSFSPVVGVFFGVGDGCLLCHQGWMSSLGSARDVSIVEKGGCLLYSQRRVSSLWSNGIVFRATGRLSSCSEGPHVPQSPDLHGHTNTQNTNDNGARSLPRLT